MRKERTNQAVFRPIIALTKGYRGRKTLLFAARKLDGHGVSSRRGIARLLSP